MHAKTLIDLAMQHTDRRSLRPFAELVGVSHTKIGEWRNGDVMPEERIRQIAKLAGQDPGPWLLLIKSEQDKGELGREWAKLAKKLAATAAVFLCAVTVAGSVVASSVSSYASNGMHIMSNVRYWWRLALLLIGQRRKPSGPYIEANL